MRAIWVAAALCLPVRALAQTTMVPDIHIGAMRNGDAEMLRGSAPIGEPREWALVSDYPAAAIAEQRRGQLSVNVAVAADDSVTGCTIAYAGGAGEDIQRAACEIVRTRGRFRHALDRQGRAQPGIAPMFFDFRLRDARLPPYGLSPSPPIPRKPGTRALPDPATTMIRVSAFANPHPSARADISASGKASKCRIIGSAGSDAGDVTVCRHIEDKVKFTPATDARGKKVAEAGVFVVVHAAP